ncbi:DUF1906 domain-containing protein [Actinophytocola sp. KF-1]
MLVLDYSEGKPGAAAIKRAGYGGAVRYIGFPSRVKCTDAAELADFTRHGLGMALVYEDHTEDWLGGFARGREAGSRARAHANRIGFPRDRPIYVAVDRDVVTSGEFATMVEYVRGASQTLGGIRVTGVYGEYDVCVRVQRAGVARWFWQSRAWSGTPPRLFPGRHLFQRAGLVEVNGIGCDINDVLQRDWGQHTEDDMQLTDRVDWDRINALGPDFLGHKILGTWQHAVASRALATQILAVVTSDPDITVARLDESVDRAIAAHVPSPEEIAAAQRDLLEEAVREVVPADQAEQILRKIAEKLSATPE